VKNAMAQIRSLDGWEKDHANVKGKPERTVQNAHLHKEVQRLSAQIIKTFTFCDH
jgi:hypothetical protein